MDVVSSHRKSLNVALLSLFAHGGFDHSESKWDAF